MTWLEYLRRLGATIGVTRWIDDAPNAPIIREDKRDALSRYALGDVVDASRYPDGIYWRFDQEDNLGRRFHIDKGHVVEIQTAFQRADGSVWRAVERW